jgi:hypothetical protein
MTTVKLLQFCTNVHYSFQNLLHSEFINVNITQKTCSKGKVITNHKNVAVGDDIITQQLKNNP